MTKKDPLAEAARILQDLEQETIKRIDAMQESRNRRPLRRTTERWDG